jgi:hypothetical protein
MYTQIIPLGSILHVLIRSQQGFHSSMLVIIQENYTMTDASDWLQAKLSEARAKHGSGMINSFHFQYPPLAASSVVADAGRGSGISAIPGLWTDSPFGRSQDQRDL